MNKTYLALAIAWVVTAGTSTTMAADDDKPGDRPNREQMREKMVERFDTDGDGKLNEQERAKARTEMRRRGEGRRDEGRRGRGRGEGKRGQGPRGNRATRGPGGAGRPEGGPGKMDPGRAFDRFDADGDGKLSRDEFKEMHAEVTSRMRDRRGPGARGPGGPEGPRGPGEFRGRGGPRGDRPPGPPEGVRGERRPPRLRDGEARGKRPGPPSESDDQTAARRGPRGFDIDRIARVHAMLHAKMRKEQQQEARGRIDSDGRYALGNRGVGGPQGRTEFNPVARKESQGKAKGKGRKQGRGARGAGNRKGQMFQRFDTDGNGQLSPQEFRRMREAIAERREGQGQGTKRGGRQGGRRGPGGPGGPPQGRPDFSSFDQETPSLNDTV